MNTLIQAMNSQRVTVLNQAGEPGERAQDAAHQALSTIPGSYRAWVRHSDVPSTLEVTIQDESGALFMCPVPTRWTTDMARCAINASARSRQLQRTVWAFRQTRTLVASV